MSRTDGAQTQRGHATVALLRACLIPAVLLGIATAAIPAGPGALRFDFETGDLQGWEVVEGAFERPVCDREFFHNEPAVPYTKQGRFFLSTLERRNGHPDDGMMGVIESPVFRLEEPTIAFMIGGGQRDETYVALCTEDGREVMHARGSDHERMQPITWDAAPYVGRSMFVRVVDRAAGGWGHVTCDDFRIAGRVDDNATRIRHGRRRSERFARAARSLRAALGDLMDTFGNRYAAGAEYLRRLDALQARAANEPDVLERLEALRREALLANPLLTAQPIVFVVRPQYRPDHHSTETVFQNGEINTASFEGGGALKTIDFAKGGEVRTLLDVPDGIVRDPEISFEGQRILVSMRRNRDDDYHIYEIALGAESPEPRQLTFGKDLADIDPMYLSDGSIVFCSTRDPKHCQCNRHIQANLFRMDADGSHTRQIGRNTLFEGHPSLMPDGRILYYRWEYVDKHFGPAFGLWTSNPDGTNHAALYHNNAWSPGAILDPRAIPGTRHVVATFGSCHDRPWGAIAIVDVAKDMEGHLPIVHSWPADLHRYLTNRKQYGEGIAEHHSAYQIDSLVGLQPKYEDPYPLSDKYILCSRSVAGERMGLFLLDVFGNEVLLHVEGAGCYDPIPLGPRAVPPRTPDRVRHAEAEGSFYVADVYRGEGMESVQRGTIKYLRIVEAPPKRFWSHGNWGIDATQAPAMNWNCTSNKRIIGDVPVAPDGSAYFTVPADRFVFFQALDANKMMVQSMRSGSMVRPGERIGCVGCHEGRRTTVPNRRPRAASMRPSRPEPWYGPERDFSYTAEVQPVFDRHCVSCHDYGWPAGKALVLAGDTGLAFNASYSALRSASPARWTPDAPDAPKKLIKAVDDGPAEILPAYSWGSHRSRLVDVIRGEHFGLKLDRESVDRIVTWIDMNAPYYGSYSTPYPDHPFGRSPLDGSQLARLSQLVGRPLGDVASEFRGSQISFTRPAMSPALLGLAERDPTAYAEALSLIEAGQRRLAERPREDMPRWTLIPSDARRQATADQRMNQEREVMRKLAERDAARK